MNGIIGMFFLMMMMLSITLTIVVTPDVSMGCFMLGTEVNADYSTEYLFLGDCR